MVPEFLWPDACQPSKLMFAMAHQVVGAVFTPSHARRFALLQDPLQKEPGIKQKREHAKALKGSHVVAKVLLTQPIMWIF